MSDAAPQPDTRSPVTELNVSGHLMTLDSGLFCIVQASASADPASGLPGVRLSLPPGRPQALEIGGFGADGWLARQGDAVLVRVANGPAQLLVTIYQERNSARGAPNLQVRRVADVAAGGRAAQMPQPAAGAPRGGASGAASGAAPAVMDMVAHIQGRGDVGALLGEWLGARGSKQWIEGFAVSPSAAVPPQDIEYQAVLGRGWLSPWAEGGQFCGSRGMALPLLGLRLRLRGASAETHAVSYSASFTDGTELGPVGDGEPCEAESLAPLEAFQIEIRARGAAARPRGRRATAEPAKAATPKSGASKTGASKRGRGKAAPAGGKGKRGG